jgi:hypothetical protein
VVRVEPARAPPEIRGACEEARRRALVLGDVLFDIRSDARKGADAWLGGPLWVTLPLTEDQRRDARPGNVGAVYLSELGPFFIHGELDFQAGTVTFPTSHLCFFTPAEEAAEAEIAALIRDQAQAGVDAAEEMLSDEFKNAVDDYLDEILPGPVKESMKMKILAKVWERREEIADLAKAVGAENGGEIVQSAGKLIGKIVVDNLDEGAFQAVLGDLMDNVDVVSAAGEAAAKARAGDPWAAAELLGRSIGEKTPLYKTVTGAAEQVQARIDQWKEHEWETAYAAWRWGAKGSFMGIHRPVQAGDWEQIESSYGGILDTVKKKFGSKHLLTSDAKASAFARKMFEERKQREQAAAREEARLQRIYKVFSGAKSWPYKGQYLEQTGLKEAPPALQFESFLRTVRAIEKDLGESGVKGGFLDWINVKEGTFMLRSEARELLNAFTQGGAEAYHKTLGEIRARIAKARAPLPAAKPKPAPKPAQPAPAKGPPTYDVQVSGDWKDRFDLVKKESRLGSAWVGQYYRTFAIGDGNFHATVVWNGKIEMPDASTRKIVGEIGGTITLREGDGQWDEGEATTIKGKFEGLLKPGPRWEGTWSAVIQGRTHRGTWSGALRH